METVGDMKISLLINYSYCAINVTSILEDYTASSVITRSQFKNHYKTIQSLAIDSILTAERRYWVCDGLYPQYFGKTKLYGTFKIRLGIRKGFA